MKRRTFFTTAAAGALPAAAQNYSDYTKDPRPDVPEGTWTAGAEDGPVFERSPVVSGPASLPRVVHAGIMAKRRRERCAASWTHQDGAIKGRMPQIKAGDE